MDKTSIALKELSVLKFYTKNMRLAAEEWENPWQTLISIILSARTRDETTIKIAKELFKKFPEAKDLANADMDDVKKIIHPINYYNNKSRNIISCSRRIVEEHRGIVPQKEEELLNLPGVGRKTMNVFLTEMGKDAIGVDTHVAYISHKFGWTKNSNPRKIEEDLKNLFPKKDWKIVNSTLVRFGKSYVSKRKQDELISEIRSKFEK